MAQNVIAARDFDLYLNFNVMGVPYKVKTGSNFSANVTGSTEDIGAFSTDEPIGTDNGGNSYDLSLTLQEAEAQLIKDAVASAYVNKGLEPPVHIRQLVEALTITVVWHKRRDVPATSTHETYTNCTGVEESDNVERRSVETLKTWRFRARGMSRKTTLLAQ